MSYIDSKEIVPKSKNGLEDYKFVSPYENKIFVYHKTTYTLRNKQFNSWLCCTEGWTLKSDNKWHETISCGWKPDRIVDDLEDVFSCYRTKR